MVGLTLFKNYTIILHTHILSILIVDQTSNSSTVTFHLQLDKMGAGFRLGKDKKSKSTTSAPRNLQPEEHGFGGPNGDPFPEVVDVDSIAEYEVNERFEQMLVSN